MWNYFTLYGLRLRSLFKPFPKVSAKTLFFSLRDRKIDYYVVKVSYQSEFVKRVVMNILLVLSVMVYILSDTFFCCIFTIL